MLSIPTSHTNRGLSQVFDTTFCGDWAGNVWSIDSACSSQAPTCQSFVQNNPSAFTDAYWSVNSLKVYQSNGAAPQSTPSAVTTPAAASTPVPAPRPTSIPGWSSSPPAFVPQQQQQHTVSALQASLFSAPTTAPVAAQALAVTTSVATSVSSPPAPTEAADSTASASAHPPSETVSPLQAGEFGLDKEKRDRGRRHARHLLEHQRRTVGA